MLQERYLFLDGKHSLGVFMGKTIFPSTELRA
jgi:hypothetical protein